MRYLLIIAGIYVVSIIWLAVIAHNAPLEPEDEHWG